MDRALGTSAAEPRGVARVEAFSDAVLAIVMTLLALELHAETPLQGAGALGALGAVAAEWPSFALFAMSFLFIALYWANHHHMLGLVERVDPPFLLANAVFLLAIALVPFSMSFLAANIGRPGLENGAAVVFALVALLCALTFNAAWWRATSAGLLRSGLRAVDVRQVRSEYALGIVFGAAGIVVAWLSAWALVLFYVAPAVFYALPRGHQGWRQRGA